MRILYGVHGYGRGHATRTLAILPHLTSKAQVLLLAGGDAYDAISPHYQVLRIPTLGFVYSRNEGAKQRSNFQSLRYNLPASLDILWQGAVFQSVREIVRDFAPHAVISDAEAWTHRVAQAMNIPRISIDHIGILAYCRPRIEWRDRLPAAMDTAVYRALMGRPDRIIISSFYQAAPRRPEVCLVGTLPRQAIRNAVARRGDHLLAYFNRGQDQLHAGLLNSLQEVGVPVRVYGAGNQGRQGRLTFLPTSQLPFVEDLASCRAVISTAGNQLVGECLCLGKPILVIPEDTVEQRLNAAAIERMKIGVRVTWQRLNAACIRRFLDRVDEFASHMRLHVRDGLGESLVAMERFLRELAPGPAKEAGIGSDSVIQSAPAHLVNH